MFLDPRKTRRTSRPKRPGQQTEGPVLIAVTRLAFGFVGRSWGYPADRQRQAGSCLGRTFRSGISRGRNFGAVAGQDFDR